MRIRSNTLKVVRTDVEECVRVRVVDMREIEIQTHKPKSCLTLNLFNCQVHTDTKNLPACLPFSLQSCWHINLLICHLGVKPEKNTSVTGQLCPSAPGLKSVIPVLWWSEKIQFQRSVIP